MLCCVGDGEGTVDCACEKHCVFWHLSIMASTELFWSEKPVALNTYAQGSSVCQYMKHCVGLLWLFYNEAL